MTSEHQAHSVAINELRARLSELEKSYHGLLVMYNDAVVELKARVSSLETQDRAARQHIDELETRVEEAEELRNQNRECKITEHGDGRSAAGGQALSDNPPVAVPTKITVYEAVDLQRLIKDLLANTDEDNRWRVEGLAIMQYIERLIAARVAPLKEKIDELERHLPCGHREIDNHDSYGGCALCSLMRAAADAENQEGEA